MKVRKNMTLKIPAQKICMKFLFLYVYLKNSERILTNETIIQETEHSFLDSIDLNSPADYGKCIYCM